MLPIIDDCTDGYTLSLGQSIDKLGADMLAISPSDRKEIAAFVKAVKAFHRINGIAGKNNDEPATSGQKLRTISFSDLL